MNNFIQHCNDIRYKEDNLMVFVFVQKQNVVPEEEWTDFMNALGRDLPAAFRISSCSVSEANALLQVIESKFFKQLIEEGDSEGEAARKPLCLPW